MDPNNRARTEAWLRYADDLGLGPYYLDRVPQSTPELTGAATETLRNSPFAVAGGPPSEVGKVGAGAKVPASPNSPSAVAAAVPRRSPDAPPSPAPKPAAFVPPVSGSSLFESAERIEGDTLDRIRDNITPNCTRCKLHKARTKIVFGVGNPKADLVFVGEGPGRDEDMQGEPFVGRAGKLLTQMIEAMSLRREDVYICNVVKCRPPENRLPEKDEVATCSPFLLRQLGVIQPKVICCLGSCSAQTMLQTTQGISRFRGEWFDFRGSKLIATYHPAYLLRNPAAKGEVWKDLQKVMAVLGLQPKPR